jgi:hypothetical protein
VEVLAPHMAAMGLTAADSDRLFFEAPSGGLLSEPELAQGECGSLRLRRLSARGAGLHDLRRANPTQLVAGGTDPKSVQPVSATATSAEPSDSIQTPWTLLIARLPRRWGGDSRGTGERGVGG